MTAEVAARRLILIDRIVRLSPEKVAAAEVALDEIETEIGLGSPEALGRSLHAIIDPRPWDELSEVMRGWFIHGATRLRKRWGGAGDNETRELRRLLECADAATESARINERATLEAWEKACNERDAAIVTLESAAENYAFAANALEVLRERASAVVAAFETSGTKWIGSSIQDLRKALLCS